MTWNEMINKRRKKEFEAPAGGELQIPVEHYLESLGHAVMHLSPFECRAVELRIVSALPIARVADRMGMSWDGADFLIDHAVRKVRNFLANCQANVNALRGEQI